MSETVPSSSLDSVKMTDDPEARVNFIDKLMIEYRPII